MVIFIKNEYTYIYLQEKRKSLETWVREFEGHGSKVFKEDLVEGEEGESQEAEEEGK